MFLSFSLSHMLKLDCVRNMKLKYVENLFATAYYARNHGNDCFSENSNGD